MHTKHSNFDTRNTISEAAPSTSDWWVTQTLSERGIADILHRMTSEIATAGVAKVTEIAITSIATTDIVNTETDTAEANTSSTDSPDQLFAFMKLPPEVRCIIYGLALQDIFDAIDYWPKRRPRPRFKDQGALALLHTSRTIRAESQPELAQLVRARRITCCALSHRLDDEYTTALCAHFVNSGSLLAILLKANEKMYNTIRLERIVLQCCSKLDGTKWV
jgi:hypothetical protein